MISPAKCHPERPNVAKGLCRTCYNKGFWQTHKEYFRQKKAARRDSLLVYWKRYNADPEMKKKRLNARFKKHGVAPFDYDAMWKKQKGRCAICNGFNRGRDLCLDHDHDTLVVRGLLCSNCNAGLGIFMDDPELVAKAHAYLVRHRQLHLVVENK